MLNTSYRGRGQLALLERGGTSRLGGTELSEQRARLAAQVPLLQARRASPRALADRLRALDTALDDFVFCTATDTVLDPDNLATRVLAPACKATKMPPWRWYARSCALLV